MAHIRGDGSSRLMEELAKNGRLTWNKICEFLEYIYSNKTGIDCDGNELQIPKAILTVPHPEAIQKVQICKAFETYNPELVCISNDGGTTIVNGWEVFYISDTGVPTSKLYFNNVDVTGTYSVVPCENNTRYDYESIKECVDGLSYTKIIVLDSNSDNTIVNVLWLDENSTPTTAPDPSLINNNNCLENKRYSTTFSTVVVTDFNVIPSFPSNTKQVVVFNNSEILLLITTNKGSQSIMPGYSATFSVYDYESSIESISMSYSNGIVTGSDYVVFNFKITL